MHSGFDNWTQSLSNRLTVQITIEEAEKRREAVERVRAVLSQTPGVTEVHVLSEGQIADLLEPWLGAGNITDDLPVPAMLDVRTEARLSLNLDALRSRLKQISDKVEIDDHQKWLAHFLKLVTMLEYVALGILLLVVMASVCIVIFGTKAGLAEHKEIIKMSIRHAQHVFMCRNKTS